MPDALRVMDPLILKTNNLVADVTTGKLSTRIDSTIVDETRLVARRPHTEPPYIYARDP